jgi:hypothetical protein
MSRPLKNNKKLANALTPLDPGKMIESVAYLPCELVPDNPVKKFSIVDVRCKDNYGRQFIVEMQMAWSSFFSKGNSVRATARMLGLSKDSAIALTPSPVQKSRQGAAFSSS